MKKITFLMAFLALLNWQANAQITIGTGTIVGKAIPVEPFYGFTYSQVIYLASEIGVSGNITTLTYYATPTTVITNSNNWTIYMGHSTKTAFATTTDWEPLVNLTQTFTGIVTISGGIVSITLDTPFNYNGTDNLIIAVDENAASYDGSGDDFYTTTVAGNRALTYRNDVTNPDPALPPTASFIYTSIANITLGGIAQACPTPSILTATALTATTANLGWTENGTATTWDIEWDTTGFTPGTGTMVTGTTTNPHNLTGLTANTSYSFYVRADCGGSGTSTWAGPFSFTTLCVAVVAPWNEDFENAGLIPSCWKQGVSNAEAWKFSNTGAGNHIGNNGTIIGTTSSNGYFAWVDDSSPNSLNTTLESPLIDVSALTIPELSFYLISNNEGFTNVNFSLNVWDGSTWNVGFYTHNTNTLAGGWEQIMVDLSALTITGPIQLRFIVDETNGTDFYDDVAIDDVDVHEAPTCPIPSVLTATSITVSSANLGWTENGSATTWNVEWDVTGFTQGTGTMVTGTTNNPNSISGLSAATTYQFYVQADCGGSGTSTWAGPFSFTTLCNTLSAPFFENFETASTSLSCWSQIQEVGAGNWTYATGAGGGTILAAQSGTQNARFVSASPSGGGTPITKLVSPILDLTTLTTPELTFYYGQEDWAGDQNKLKVYYRISPSDPWVEIAYDTTNVAAWTKDTLILPSPSATYQIAFEGINNYGRANVIDDVEIKEALLVCSIPSNLTAFNITQTSALLDWTENGTATEWNIEWGFQGFTLGTGTPVHVLSKPYLLNGLMPSTPYDYYVQADCGTDSSAWVGPYTFMTPPCMPIGLELGADTTLCSTQSLTLNAPTGGPYGWSWSTGESTPSIVVDTTSLGGNGTYNISVSIIDFSTTCFYNDNINVTFSVCVGLNENVTAGFAIYPNPSNGTFTLSANEKGTVEITNLQGKVIFKNRLDSNTQVIDLTENAKGIYFVNITTAKGVEVQKIVIQ